MIGVGELKQFKFFEDFSERGLVELAAVADPVHLESGEVLFQFGETSKNLYFLKSGSLLVAYRNGCSFVLREPGEMVGWSAVASPYRYMATVVGLIDSTLFRFSTTDLSRALRLDGSLAKHFNERVSSIIQCRRAYWLNSTRPRRGPEN